MERTIRLSEDSRVDARTRFAEALDDARRHPGTTVIVPPDEYRIASELAIRTRDEAIGGAYGENPEDRMFDPDFAFTEGISLEGHKGTTLLAHGAALMIDGFMEPVCLKNCEDVSIEGLTIDHVRKPYSRGRIEGYCAEQGWMEVRFDDAFPVDGHTVMPRCCVYDEATGRFNLDVRIARRTYLGEQHFRFDMRKMPEKDMTGQTFYIWHSLHYRPAILIEDARNITLRDVTIHSQPGMGIVGHRGQDILLERLRVVPSPGEHLSVNTDATHFTSCKGALTFRDCEFDGHGDDATNVHTFYHDLQRLSPTTYRGSTGVKTHSLTLDWPDAGDEMELVDKRSLTVRGRYRVVSVRREDAAYVAELDGPLPEDAQDQCWIADVTRLPDLTFEGCRANNHWARSVLIKTRRARVENCQFRGSALCAIHVAAEGWWHEGVTSQDVVIRGNRFVDCGISGHADAGGIKVEVSAQRPEGTPQRGIVIEDNLFDLRDVSCAISVSNAERVRIARNRFSALPEPVRIVDCRDVELGEALPLLS